MGLIALVAAYAFLDLVAAAPNSPLLPPLPKGVGVPAWMARGAGDIGLDRIGRFGLTLAAISALAVAAAAFVVVLVEALRGRAGMGAMAVAAAGSLLLAVLAPVLLSRDVYSYAAYGRSLALHHANPYATPPSAFPHDPFTAVTSPEWRDTRSVYGPAFTLLSAGIARLWSGSPAGTIAAFKVVAALAVAAAAGFGAAAARLWGARARAPAAIVLIALNPVMVIHTVGGGHNDALVAAGLAAAAFLAAPRARSDGPLPFAVTAVLTVTTLVKIVAAIPLLLWVWSVAALRPRDRRARAVGKHAAVAAAAAVAGTVPVLAGWRTVTALANLASRQGWASGARLVARGAEAVGRGLGPAGLGTTLGDLVYAAFLILFGLVLWRLRDGPGLPPGRWAAGLLAFALAAPYLLPWYSAWFLCVLALMADEGLLWTGVAASCLLALTGVPAEPGSAPALWRDMVLAVHYAAAPVMLALLGSVLWRTLLVPRRRGRRPAGTVGPAGPAGSVGTVGSVGSIGSGP